MMCGQFFQRIGAGNELQHRPASKGVQNCQWLTDAKLSRNKLFLVQDTPFPGAERVKKNCQRIADEDIGRNLTLEGASADTEILALEEAAVDTNMVKQKN